MLKGFISISQGLVSPISAKAFLSVISRKAYIENFIRALGSFYGIWNLDFFRIIKVHALYRILCCCPSVHILS